jgi:AAA family ATP:ADP antiporter
VIDTAVYRGADAASGWVKTGVDAIASNPAVVAVAGAVLALVSAFPGWSLARQQRTLAAGAAAKALNSLLT